MTFEHDIYISYFHIDNRPLSETKAGWVSALRNYLQVRLSQLLGKEPLIWMHTGIVVGEPIAKEIFQVIKKSAVFMPIVTPGYSESKWCREELLAFIKSSGDTGGLALGNKSRIFKVIKTPVPIESLHSALQALVGYEFFKLDPVTGRQIEFSNDGPTEKDYYYRLDDLAHPIAEILREFEESKGMGKKSEVNEKSEQREQKEATETEDEVSDTMMDETSESSVVDLSRRPVSVHLHSDLWTLDDRLGYSLYAKAIAEFIHHKNTRPPLTIGIYAPWGQGKTTLMKLIEYQLKRLSQDENSVGENHKSAGKNSEPAPGGSRTTFKELKNWLNNVMPPKLNKLRHPTIWFNAWKFQSREQVWAGLAHFIISDLVTQIPKSIDREKFWLALQAKRLDFNKIRSDIQNSVIKHILPKIFNLGMLLGILALVGTFVILGVFLANFFSLAFGSSLSAFGTLLIGAGKWIYEKRKVLKKPIEGDFSRYVSKPDYEGKRGFFSQVDQDIRRVFSLLVDPKYPAVIFVDDLDRCSSSKVAEVMEAINLFLSGDFPNVYFIIGMDAQAVAACMEVAHESLTKKLQATTRRYGSLGWYFMEKMVQLPFVIPVITDQQRDGYLEELFQIKGKAKQYDQQDTQMFEKQIEDVLQKESVDKLVEKFAKSAEILNKLDANKRREFQERAIQKGARAFRDDSAEIQMHLQRYAPYLGNKPRTIKRFVNLYRFYRMAQWARQLQNLEAANPAALGRWIVIMLRWPQMVRWIQWEGELGLFITDSPYKKAEKIEKMADESKDFGNWLKTLAENGIEDIDWLIEEVLYQFLRKRLDEKERLTKALEVGVW